MFAAQQKDLVRETIDGIEETPVSVWGWE
jgi:hypothetical protein